MADEINLTIEEEVVEVLEVAEQGPAGIGSAWRLLATGLPDATLGTDGDYALVQDTLCIYGPRATIDAVVSWPYVACIAGTALAAPIVAALEAANAPDAGNPFATMADVAQAVAALLDSSPAALDTLAELAAALGDDANFAATITNALAGKEPAQTPASQAEAEAGTEAALRSWSVLRVWQAIRAAFKKITGQAWSVTDFGTLAPDAALTMDAAAGSEFIAKLPTSGTTAVSITNAPGAEKAYLVLNLVTQAALPTVNWGTIDIGSLTLAINTTYKLAVEPVYLTSAWKWVIKEMHSEADA